MIKKLLLKKLTAKFQVTQLFTKSAVFSWNLADYCGIVNL